MVSILAVGLSVRLLCPDLSDSSSLTEHTSDNQKGPHFQNRGAAPVVVIVVAGN